MEVCLSVALARFRGFNLYFSCFSLLGTDYIHAKQVRDKEKLKAGETKKRLRDLSVIMDIKKDLIKELVKTGVSMFYTVCNVFDFVLLIILSYYFFHSDRKRAQSFVETQSLQKRR